MDTRTQPQATDTQANTRDPSQHLYRHSRGFLPHFDQPGLLQSITFRLADALPVDVLERLSARKDKWDEPVERSAVEQYLDAGHGACYLRDPRIATIVQNAFLFFDGQRYRLLAWVVMPNHVHVVIEVFDGFPLDRVVSSWKSYTAKQANQLLGRTGQFWSIEYFDRMVRDETHLANLIRYLHENPVRAGLVRKPEDWPFSSALVWQERFENAGSV